MSASQGEVRLLQLRDTPPRQHRRGGDLIWLAPVLAVFAVFYVVPLLRMAAVSVDGTQLSLHNYAYLLHEDIYATVLVITFKISLYVTLACISVGYPVAYYLSKLHGGALSIGLAFVLLPFWTSVLVRNYAWYVLL